MTKPFAGLFILFLITFCLQPVVNAQNCAVNASVPQTLCENETLTLFGGFVGVPGGAFYWQQISGPSVIIDDPFALSTTVTGITGPNTYTFRIYALCGDGSVVFDEVTHTVLPITQADAGPDQSSCPGTNVITMAANSPAAGENGLWSIIGNNSGVNINNISDPNTSLTLSETSYGTATLVWTVASSNCQSSDTVLITNCGGEMPVDARRNNSNTVSLSPCYTTTQSYRASASFPGNPDCGQQGVWNIISGPSLPNVSNFNDRRANFTNLIEGTYVLEWCVSGPCASGCDQLTLIVPGPVGEVTNASASGGVYCEGITEAILTGNSPVYTGEEVTWSQSGGPACTIVSPNSPLTAVTGLDGSSTYTFVYTIENTSSGCSSDDNAQVTYTAAPTLSLGPDQVLGCGVIQASVPFTSTGTGPVSWQILDGPAGNPTYPAYPTPWYNAGSSPTTIPFLTVGGNYYIVFRKIEAAGTGCANVYDDISITVSNSPSLANAGSDQLLACNVDTTFLVGNDPSLTGGGFGTWYQVFKPQGGNDAIIDDPENYITKITNLSNGLYTFRWIITGGGPGCPSSQDDVNVAVAGTTPTIADAGADNTICFGTPYQLQGNPVALNETGTWTVTPSSGVVFDDPSDHNTWVDGLAASTVYTFTWTITNACGLTSDDVLITTSATQGPVAADAGPDMCYPSGTSVITLSANDPSPGTGQWNTVSSPAAFTYDDPTSPTTNINISLDGTYVLEWVTTYNACTDSRDTVKLTVSALPSPSDAGPDQVLCGDSTDLAAITPIVGTGVWRQVIGPPGVIISDTTDPAATITGLVDGIYGFQWTVTNGVCFGGADTVMVYVSLPPEPADAGPDQFLCGTDNTLMAANAISGNLAYWKLVDGPNTPGFDPFDPLTTLSGMLMGTYVFTWNSVNQPNCPPSIDTVEIEVVPVADVIASQEFCDTISVALNGNPNSVGYWEQVILGTEPVINVIPTGNSSAIADSLLPGSGFTDYAFRYVIDYPGCTSADTTYISVYEPPSIAAAGPDQELCDASSFTLAATLPVSGTGNWSILSGPGSGSFVDPSDPGTDFTGAVPGVYIFLWTVENGACSNADPVRIDNYAPPTPADASVTPYQDYYCDSSLFMLGNLPLDGVGTWTQKSGPNTANIVSPILPDTEINGLVPGTYEFYWTITNGPVCPPSIDSCVIVVATLPSVPDAGPDQEICEIAPVQTNMAANIISTGLGTWTQHSGPNTATIADPNLNTTQISDMIGGLYEFIWTAQTDSCSYSDTMTVQVYELPTPAEAGPDSTVCISDPLNLYADPALIGTGTWSQLAGPSAASFVDPNSPTTGVFGLTNGLYRFEWRTANGPCVESVDSVSITISPLPSFANAGPDQQLCEGDSVRLDGNVPAVGTGYWTQTGGPPCTIVDPSLPNTDVLFLQYGVSTFLWTITSGACDESDEVEITRYQLPSMSDAGPDQVQCSNVTSVNMAANIPLVGTGLWTQASGPPANIVIPSSPTTEINGLVPGAFEFVWTISTPGICPSSEDTVNVLIENCAPEVLGANGFPVINGVISGLATCANNDLEICIDATDPEGDPVDISAVTILTGSGSTWSDPVAGDTCFTYEPAAGYTGPELLEVVVCDNSLPPDCDTVIISLTVTAETIAYAGADAEICETDDYTVSDASASNHAGISWSTGGDGTFNDNTLLNPTYTPGSGDILSGSATLTITAAGAGSCPDAVDDLLLTISPPSTAFAGADAEICETDTYLISDATASGFDTLYWTTSGTGSFSDPNIVNPVYIPSQNDINDGFVILTLNTGTDVCATVSDNMTLSITPSASADAGADAAVCETIGAYLLADATASDYDSLLWVSSGDGSFDDDQVLNPAYTIGAGDIASGSVSLTLTAYGSGSCVDAVDAMVLDISLQPIAAAGPDDEMCESELTYTLANATATNATSVLWTTDGTGSFDDPGLVNPVYSPSISDVQDGQVMLSMTAFGDGVCPDASDFMILTIWQEAEVYAGKDDTICEGQNFQPLDADAQYYTAIAWTSSGDGSFNDNALLHPVYTPGPGDIAAGSVTLTITATANGTCPDTSDDLVLTILENPTAFAGIDAEICETGVYALADATASGYSSLLWTSSGTGSFNDPTALNPVYTPSQNDIDDGFVILTLTAYSLSSCCPDASDNMTLTITAQPEVFAGADASICSPPGTYTITDAVAEDFSAIEWTSTGDGSFDDISIIDPTYTAGPDDILAGSVSLVLTAFGNASCPDVSDTLVLSISIQPTAFAGPDDEICETQTSYSLALATAANFTSVQWTTDGSGTFDDPGLVNPVYFPSASDIQDGQVRLSMTAFGDGVCPDATDEMLLTIWHLAEVYAGADATVCEDEEYLLWDASAQYYTGLLWTTSGDGTFDNDTTLNPTYTPGPADIAAGSAVLTLTAISEGVCPPVSDDMTLSIEAAPVVFAGDDAEICETDTYEILDATASNYSSLLWTTGGDGSFNDPTLLNPVYTPGTGDIITGYATLTLTAYGNMPCGDTSDMMMLTITPAPTVYAGVDAHICETETYVLIDSDAEDYASLLWTSSGDGTFSDPAILHPEYYPGIADIQDGGAWLYLTATGLGSCDDAVDSMYLEISQLPEAYAGPDDEMCESEVSYFLGGATAVNYTSVKWTTDGTGTFDNSTLINPVYTPSQSDIQNGQVVLTITVFGDGYCPDDVDFMVLTIWPSVEVYAGADAEICEDDTYRILDASAENDSALIWTTSGDGFFDDVSILTPLYTPGANDIANGSATLILTAFGMGNCPAASDTMVLTVTALPEADAGPDAAICEGDAFQLTGAGASGYNSLLWTTSGDGSFDDPTLLDPVYTPGTGDINTGSVVLTLTAYGNGSCGNASDNMVLSIDGEAFAFAGGDGEVCEGASFFLENALAQNFKTITWTTSGDGTFDDPGIMRPVYTPGTDDIAGGSVILTMSVQGIGACEDVSDQMTLTITASAVAFAGDDADICETDTYILSDATAGNYASINWTTGGDGTFNDASILNPVYTPGLTDINTGSVILTLNLQGNGSCGEVSDQMTLQIHAEPVADAGDGGEVCFGEAFQVNGAEAENASYVMWTSSGNGVFSDPMILEPVYFAGSADLSAGFAELVLTAYGYGSCGSSSDTIVLAVHEVPTANAGPDQVIPPGTATQLNGSATGGSGDYIYSWTPGDYIINSNAQNPTTFPILDTTTFFLTVTDNLTGCVGRDTVVVYTEQGHMPPEATDDYDTTYVNIPVVVNVLGNDFDPENGDLDVSLCGGPYNGIATVNSDGTITYTPYNSYTGDDSLCYFVCDNGNPPYCDSAMVFIHVIPLDAIDDNIIIYNGFTPNGDGFNDKWIIDGIELYPDNEVFIFNRWGDIIKEIYGYDNVNNFWNGTNINNERLPDGTYYYILKVLYEGQEKYYKGWIYIHGVVN